MVGWNGITTKKFYGHSFKLTDEGLDKIAKEKIHFRPKKRMKRAGRACARKYNYRKKKISELAKKNTLKSFHKLRYNDIALQQKWFLALKKSDKMSPTGIYNSIRYIRHSDYHWTVGQKKYYTEYLIHGNKGNNEDGLIHPTRESEWWDQRYLRIDRFGTGDYEFVLTVAPYESEGNYILESFKEAKPWVHKDFKYGLIHGSY